MSRLQDIEDQYLGGKLGFSRRHAAEQVTFDESRGDFVTRLAEGEQCSFAHFVVFCEEGADAAKIVFEERPPDIRRQSFLGAFQALLKVDDMSFVVDVDREKIEFSTWLHRVNRVVKFTGKARVPNPSWSADAEQIQRIIERTNADVIQIDAKVVTPEKSLDVEGSLLAAIVAHSDAGYGEYSASGDREGDRYVYKDGLTEVMDDVAESPADDSLTIWKRIIQVAERRFRGLLGA